MVRLMVRQEYALSIPITVSTQNKTCRQKLFILRGSRVSLFRLCVRWLQREAPSPRVNFLSSRGGYRKKDLSSEVERGVRSCLPKDRAMATFPHPDNR